MIGHAALEDRLWNALHDVEDPELPISIVDLGLIVDLSFEDGTVSLKLTFTAMGCPAMDMVMDDVRARLGREPEVESTRIEIVWEPIWTKSRLTEDGKAQLREAGISV
jgi:metal-sulfur cluster biosynthetic enzyme